MAGTGHSQEVYGGLSVSVVVVVVVVEASALKVYPRVTLARASTPSGSVVRTLRSGEGLPNMFRLVASSLGHLRSQCSIVCGSSVQRGHRGPAEGSRRLAEVFSNGVWPARWRARRTASARLLVAMQSLDQENPPYTSTVLEFVGGGSTSVLRMRDLAEAYEMGSLLVLVRPHRQGPTEG